MNLKFKTDLERTSRFFSKNAAPYNQINMGKFHIHLTQGKAFHKDIKTPRSWLKK